MLLLVRSMKDLRFGDLMAVYSQTNRSDGAARYPEETPARQEMLAEQDFFRYLQDCFFKTRDAVYAIWVENGQYVSALRLEPHRNGFLLAGLETAPEHRRKGYAKKLMEAALHEKTGRPVYSHVRKQNKPSLDVHLKCGFRIVSNAAVYTDGSAEWGAFTLCKEK